MSKPPIIPLETIVPGFGSIDIGQEKIFVACGGTNDVQSFGTCTADYHLALKHLQQQGVQRVAMEATGVYWIPLHDLLQEHQIEVTVFNGAHARNMPGRKSDVLDSQWHAMLHSHGLLVPCFIPNEDIRQLRCFYRLREDHLEIGGAHIQHMQRALDLMNIRLHVVISQIHGVSGMRVLKAILAGQRDPSVLAELCDAQILTKKRAAVLKSLEGNWQEHHLFALRQAVEGYEFCQRQMAACDEQIEVLLERLAKAQPAPPPPPPGAEAQKPKLIRHNAPAIPKLHEYLLALTGGHDVTRLPGFTDLGFMKLIAETGTDLTRWKTEKHFTSWATLAPGSSQSGRRRKRVPRKKSKVGQIFREAVMSIAKSKHLALGAAYRRLKGRTSPGVAMVAIARKLAVLYYRVMTKGLAYAEQGIAKYEEKYREQTLRYLQKKAREFGHELTPNPTPHPAAT